MEKGDLIQTPRFLTVRIDAMFESEKAARAEGYYEPTHYENSDYKILGKSTGLNLMVFAGVKKQG
jgi:hypothetical protein